MSDSVRFLLDGHEVETRAGESIWQVAKRQGNHLPHLCHADKIDYRADGNCRACMVEIDGERTLAASCIRIPTSGMKVQTKSARAENARRAVIELLLADQPARADAHDPDSKLWQWADKIGVSASRYPRADKPPSDGSHPAIAVNLDACINCTLCLRACREVQVNDVIGMAYRGSHAKIVFDFDDAMGASTCVACGECVEACPTGALMPASIVDEKGHGSKHADNVVRTVCPFCGVGCQLTMHVRDNRIAFVEGADGPANRNRLCVKGRFGFDYVHHPHRLTAPLIRRADVAKDPHHPLDPGNPLAAFREATWDEALEAAAAGLKKIRAAHGGKGLAGFGSAKCSNEEAYLFQKLIRTGFGSNNVDHCTRLCHASSVAALLEGVGSGAVSASFNQVENADVIIVIGANPTENHPVAATFFKAAAKRGATLIVMDPRGQALKRHASHMLQFSPGGDVALLNAIMHVIVAEKLFKPAYIAEHTEGFAAMRDHLATFTPEAMAAVTGIAPEVVREVARAYATADAAMIFWGMGVSQHVHGTDNARCLISLALMCGHVGRPGTGLHPLRGQNNVQGASDAGLIPMMFPDYHRTADDAYRAMLSALWQYPLTATPGLTVVEIIDAIHGDVIKGMYILGENPAMSDPDAGHAREALAKLDHLVVQDIFLTETAYYADVVLPAAAWPEKTGTVTNTNRQVQMGRAALRPPGSARPDWEIVQELARRLGLPWAYDHIRDVYSEMQQVMPSLNNISWRRLEREHAVTYPCDAADATGHDVVFGDRFPTTSGRARFVPADLVSPNERPDAQYPLVLITGRQLEHWHTGAMTRRSVVLDALEPAPTVAIAPEECARLGLKAGERVRVESRRGAVELTVRADPAVPKGAVFIPFAYHEAAANLLTNPALDPFGKIPEFKYCAVRVSALAQGDLMP